MPTTARTLVCVALVLVTAPLSYSQSISPDQIESVYRVVLADPRCSGRGLLKSGESVPVIHRELVSPARESWWTSTGPMPSFADRARTSLPPRLVDAFSGLRSDELLTESMAKALGAVTIGQTDVEALAANTDYWAAFFRRFPSASAQVRLSPVAFDVVAREALVYCGYSASAIGGEGSIVHLRQTNGMWTALVWHQVWIS